MSGFYGELTLPGAGTPYPGHLARMDRTMVQWGGDGADTWCEGPCALGARLLRVSPEETHDIQPRVEPDLALVGHVRLDDRQRLARELGLDPTSLPHTLDSHLLALAWRRWGTDCAEHLYGDWVCALWDRRRQCLWLARDAAGNTSLFCWHNDRRLVFATSLPTLLAHPAVPREPDAYHLARLLTVFNDPAHADTTAYAGIRCLPGGHALLAEAGSIAVRRWWQPETLPEFAPAPDAEYHAGFRDIYAQAVADRLHTAQGSVGILLSAGLDSASVAALAAPLLAAKGQRLQALTSVPHFPPDAASARRLGDEGPLARAFAADLGTVDWEPISSPDTHLLASLDHLLDHHGQPLHGVGNYFWLLDALARAHELGVRVLLTGQGGNFTVSWPGTGIVWPALRAGHWRDAIGLLNREPGGLWPGLKRQIRPGLRAGKNRLGAWRRSQTTPWSSYSALHPDLAASLRLHERMRAAGHDIGSGGRLDPRHPQNAFLRLGWGRGGILGSFWMQLAARNGLEARDPTRDRRVIEYCWRVPDRTFWAGGHKRGLIRHGCADLLPDAIRTRATVGLQRADIGWRILREREAIRGRLHGLTTHPLAAAWLNLPAMHEALKSLEDQVTPATSQRAASVLLRGLVAGCFLTRF